LDEQASIKKEKNFFETRVTDYQSGGALKFDDGPETLEDLVNWK
jgi:ribonucleotide reductase beta subunit family protein with ferritin-like domain